MLETLFGAVVVGYESTGQTLAILLGKMGYCVAVYERYPSLYPLPRIVQIDHKVLHIFQSISVIEDLLSKLVSAMVYEWRNAKEDTLLRVPLCYRTCSP